MQRIEITRAGANALIERGHGFDVMIEHIWPRTCNNRNGVFFAQEIGRQNLNGRIGRGGANEGDTLRKMRGSAILEVIAVNAGDDHMLEAELAHRFGKVLRLMWVEFIGRTRRDVAKRAGTGAHTAQNHHRGVAFAPAFANVGASRFFAYGVELVFAHEVARIQIPLALRRFHANPIGLWQFLVGRLGDVEVFSHKAYLIAIIKKASASLILTRCGATVTSFFDALDDGFRSEAFGGRTLLSARKTLEIFGTKRFF